MDPNRLLHVERVVAGGGPPSPGDTGVRILHLNNPVTLNSLTNSMASEFSAVLDELRADTGMRALIITGNGRAFSAGGDFQFIEDRILGSVEDNEAALRSFYLTFLQIRTLPVPTIAAINGPAVGGGMCFAMACDLRLASTTAKMGFNFVKLGITPGMAATALLPAATNHQVACRLLLTGDLVGSEEAKQLGLVLDVHPPQQLLPAAKALAARMAAAAPGAGAATLRLLRAQLPWETVAATAGAEAGLQAEGFKGPDILEGLAAVRERREPHFHRETGDALDGATADANGRA